MPMTRYLPLSLKIDSDQRILIVGGGPVARGKVDALLPHAASLHVVAEKMEPALEILLKQHHISYQIMPYHSKHLEGAGLVIAATSNPDTNARIHEHAKTKGILVNCVDQPDRCDVIFPAMVRRGSLQVAISSGGASPVLVRMVKQKIEQALPWNLDRLADFAQRKRTQVKNALRTIQAKRLFWQSIFNSSVAEDVLEGNDSRADKSFNEALQQAAKEADLAALYLIGAGPGHPELITVKGLRLLSQADVVLYDRLTSPQLLEHYARRDAEKICVGKGRDHHRLTQEEIDALIEQCLRKGQIVARLKGGDPGVFAHGAEEIAIAQKLGVPFQIVPGISAANGCAAYAGIPLTARNGAHSVRFLTLYKETLQDEDYWKDFHASTKETLVFYMSAKHHDALCQRLLTAGLPNGTPVLAIEQGTTPSHREFEAPLADFAETYRNHSFASPTLLIIGNVVAWRNQHGWKEQALGALSFFTDLNEDEHVHH